MVLELTLSDIHFTYATEALLYILQHRWEVLLLTTLLLTFSRQDKKITVIWLVLFLLGFFAANFITVLYLRQLFSLVLVFLGLSVLLRKDKEVYFPLSYVCLGSLLAGLAWGRTYYSNLTSVTNGWLVGFTNGWQLTVALLLSMVSILPALWLNHSHNKISVILRNRLPLFALLAGGAELLWDFLY